MEMLFEALQHLLLSLLMLVLSMELIVHIFKQEHEHLQMSHPLYGSWSRMRRAAYILAEGRFWPRLILAIGMFALYRSSGYTGEHVLNVWDVYYQLMSVRKI
jgi:hypothetical protein